MSGVIPATHKKARWVIDVKRSGRDPEDCEISILRDDFGHGKQSHGCESHDQKIIVAGSGGPCLYRYERSLQNRLIRIAAELAAEKNIAEEQTCPYDVEPSPLVGHTLPRYDQTVYPPAPYGYERWLLEEDAIPAAERVEVISHKPE